jgi:DNA-binding ferritin-like protein
MVDVLLGAAQTVFQAQQSCLEANEQVSANLLMDAASKLDKARWQLSMYLASQADD